MLRKGICPPNLVGRIPHQCIIHGWDQRSCRGQLEVSIYVRLPNLVGRIPDQSVVHHGGVSLSEGHKRGATLGLPEVNSEIIVKQRGK